MESDWIWHSIVHFLKCPKNGNDNNSDKLKDRETLHFTS